MLAKLKNIDRRLFTILMIVFVQMLGASMILPVLPLYAKRQFGLSPQAITLLVSSFFAAQFLAGPTIGRLSDKYGRLPVLIVSQIGTAFSFAMIGLAQTAELLFVARLLDGITGGNIIVAQAYITDITPREQRTQALGYIFAAFGLGFIFGPAIGGILTASFGPELPFLLAAGAALATVLLTWRTLDESLTPAQRLANRAYRRDSLSPRQIIRNSSLALVLTIGFVAQFGFGLLQSTFALYGEAILFADYSEQVTNLGIGLLLAVVGVSQFLTQTTLLRPALARFGEMMVVILGTVFRAFGMFLFAIAVGPWLGVPGSIFFALGMGMMMPSLQSISTGTVADELRGGVLGLYQSTVSLATIFSTALAGIIFAQDPRLPYWLGVALTLLSLLPALTLWRRWPRLKEAEVATAVSD